VNYQKIYNDLIENAKNRVTDGYIEKHHIIPKCFGGLDTEDNLVKLYPREHYIAHLLLYKIQTEKRKIYQMLKVVVAMSGRKGFNSRLYEEAKIKFSKMCSERMTGENHHMYGKIHPNKGKRNLFNLSDEAKRKCSENQKGLVMCKSLSNPERGILKVTKEEFDNNIDLVGTTYNCNSKVKGRIGIHKGDEKKLVEPDLLEKYLKDGWIKGIPKKKEKCPFCDMKLSKQNLKRHISSKHS